MRKIRVIIPMLVWLLFVLTACTSPGLSPSKSEVTFETIGIKGATVFATLVSPSPDEASAEELANGVRREWQDQRFPGINPGHVRVMIFDRKDAPQRWLQIWDSLASMSDQEWAKEEAQIFPHYIAQYSRNTTTGLHQVEFYSRDIEQKIVRAIKF